MKSFPRLYAVADASFGDPISIAKALFQGGARLVQVRNKTASSSLLLKQVESIISEAPPDALIIVNDRVDVARISRAAGVHLGQDDLPPTEARLILGPDAIIGLSTHDIRQALDACMMPLDYIAIGPIFATSTKTDASPVVGTAGLRAITQVVTRPVVAIGGITRANAAEVYQTGANTVAVIRDILDTTDIAARVREWTGYNQN